MADTLISVNLSESPHTNEMVHNRWHCDIPMACWVEPGDDFKVETYDWTGGQIKNDDDAADVRDVELQQVHYLSGPIGVKGAEPGDLLVVDILDIGAKEEMNWGFNGFFSKKNGGGFLTDHFPEAQKSIWDFDGMFTKSRHVPGVKYAGLIHPGLIGCLPDRKMLDTWNAREKALVDTDPDRVPELATLPNTKSAHMGKMTGEDRDKAAAEAARTVPPREHGGNCDIKDLSRGSKIYFPVYVDGAGLSMGDLHFSQGDGEITFCGAIEMAGWLHIRVTLIKGGMEKYAIKNPIFRPSPIVPKYDDYLIFEGISVDESGTQHYLDVHIAYRQACLNAIEYLKKFGYSGAQGYAILGTAPVQGHISGVVDIPNACATLWLPTDIFEGGASLMPSPDGRWRWSTARSTSRSPPISEAPPRAGEPLARAILFEGDTDAKLRLRVSELRSIRSISAHVRRLRPLRVPGLRGHSAARAVTGAGTGDNGRSASCRPCRERAQRRQPKTA